jgi:hypothetical protein
MPPGSPNRVAPFLEPSFHFQSQFLVNGPPPQIHQWDPYRERHPSTEPSTSHPLENTFPSESPVKEPPPCSPTGSLGRVILRLQSPWSIYSFMFTKVPKKGALLQNGEKVRSPSTEPHVDGRPIYSGVRHGSTRGSLTTLLFLPQCHAALGTIPSTLAWVGQSPISQHVT